MCIYTHSYNVILDNMDLSEYRLKPIAAIMYLQDNFARYCATKKVAAYDLFPHNMYWIVSEFNIEFTDNLPFWSEEIRTDLWISEMTKLKIYTDFKLFSNNNLFAKGYGCWFILDQNTKKPIKTDFINDKFEILNELVFGEHKKLTFSDSTNALNKIVHKNNLSDIDFNSHVNNKSYINIADASISNEYKKTHSLKELHIKYNKESFLNDELICNTYQTSDLNTFVHKISKENSSICEIETKWTDKRLSDDILHSDLHVKNELT